MCSIDSGLWCWDTTTKAASDDALSQRQGWRGLLSFFLELHACQGRVTLHCKCLQAVWGHNNWEPDNNADLDTKIKMEFMKAYEVNLTMDKFLQEEPKNKTPEKKASCIIVKILEKDPPQFEPRFLFMGNHKEAQIMWHPTPITQYPRCWKYGHPRVGCKETTHPCPVCSQRYRDADHKWLETASRGYTKLIPRCCIMTPQIYTTCEGPHSAKGRECLEIFRVKEEAQRKYDQRMASLADAGKMDTQN